MIYAGLYFLVGVIVFACAVWINPDTYNSEYDAEEAFFATILTITMWPAAVLFWATNGLRKVLVRTKKEKLKLREELDKEVSAARREVEDLLNGVRGR